jgi:hypothetical protein
MLALRMLGQRNLSHEAGTRYHRLALLQGDALAMIFCAWHTEKIPDDTGTG